MNFKRPKTIKTGLDITPLIDVVFILLLFFMLTSNFIVENGLELNLPKSTTADEQTQNTQNNLVIFIDQSQHIFVGENQYNFSELNRLLLKKETAGDLALVTLKADEKVPVGFMIQVMDVVRKINGEKMVISTEKLAGGVNETQ
ncbi:ExbD/TolR family protein [Halanaerobium salsuginis]|jgi:biopolymer transport protein ExbD|uniref:Biopolymer transport protein ExbD n=1 Tax=Halanaerobium salsuginis TaxID=29563 RepID=A0A1I4I1T0_9FIRM|nr:biopolymer transporter ExbD [Halanaerobium salsuginis]SFL48398.1 biopolymer transport protein ExbD [Halanaerobium salsuginis]